MYRTLLLLEEGSYPLHAIFAVKTEHAKGDMKLLWNGQEGRVKSFRVLKESRCLDGKRSERILNSPMGKGQR